MTSINELIFIGINPLSYTDFGIYAKTYNMIGLKKLYINNAYGLLPNFGSQQQWTNFSISQLPGQTLKVEFPIYPFSSSLLHYELILTTQPTGSLPPNIFTLSPNLQHFLIKAPSTVNISQFYQLPPTMKTLGFIDITLTNPQFPSFDTTSWSGLRNLSLVNLGLTGTFDPQFMYSSNLIYLNINKNPSLSYSLDTEFGEQSNLIYLYSENTALVGQVPYNILYNGLQFLYVRNTSLNGILPSPFLCCSSDSLYVRSIPPSYLFNNDAFSNYQGPTKPRTCNPTIDSIEPNPLTANVTNIRINGTDLGNSFQISMVNTAGDETTVGCSIEGPDLLNCINPFIQGEGTLTVKLFVSSLPTNSTSFRYVSPSVTTISTPSTLGGLVTITGSDLFKDNSNALKSSFVRIYGIECTNINVLVPFEQFTCLYVPGITSGTPVVVNVKGLENNSTESPLFYYKSPIVTSSLALPPNKKTSLTIYGNDFYNIVNQTTVVIGGNINCPVTLVNHNTIICDFPSTPFSNIPLSIIVNVNSQISQPNKLFQFIDPAVCPDSCTNGVCDVGIGSCVCNGGSFGPSCAETPQSLTQLPNSGLNSPILSLTTNVNSDIKLDFYLYSVIENQIETIVQGSNWVSSYNQSSNIWKFQWSFVGKEIEVNIVYNNVTGSNIISGSKLSFPKSSFSYIVRYKNTVPVATLSFKVGFNSVEDCPTTPEIAYPSASPYKDARWMVWVKENVKYYSRFPVTSLLNDEYTQIQSNPLSFDEYEDPIIQIDYPPNLIYSSNFQYDFQVIQATEDESQPLSSDCLPKNSEKKNKAAIIGGVLGAFGGLLIIGAAIFIVKQQMKIRNTKSLLNEKLKSLNLNN